MTEETQCDHIADARKLVAPETGTPATTAQLRTLEADVERYSELQYPQEHYGYKEAVARLETYRMALSDLDARYGDVVRAARNMVLPTDHPPTCRSCQKDLADLRDTLAALEVA